MGKEAVVVQGLTIPQAPGTTGDPCILWKLRNGTSRMSAF